MSNKRKNDDDSRSGDKHARGSRDDSSESINESDLKRIMSEAVAAQIPRLILETSKVVTEQLGAERNES